MSEIVKEVRAVADSRGGEIVHIITSYDHERDGRRVEAVLFFPGTSGYDNTEDTDFPPLADQERETR
jgi:hypothetical protein